MRPSTYRGLSCGEMQVQTGLQTHETSSLPKLGLRKNTTEQVVSLLFINLAAHSLMPSRTFLPLMSLLGMEIMPHIR